MSYLKSLTVLITVCMVSFAGCLNAGSRAKKEAVIPVNLPGMGNYAPAKGVLNSEKSAVGAISIEEAKSAEADKAPVKPVETLNETIAQKETPEAVESPAIAENTPVVTESERPVIENISETAVEEPKAEAILIPEPVETHTMPAAKVTAVEPVQAVAPVPEKTAGEIITTEVFIVSISSITAQPPARTDVTVPEAPAAPAAVQLSAPVSVPEVLAEKAVIAPVIVAEPTPSAVKNTSHKYGSQTLEARPAPAVRPRGPETATLSRPAAPAVVEMPGKKEKKTYEIRKRAGGSSEKAHPMKIHMVLAGDNLPMLAEKYYGDRSMWTKIFEVNKDKIEKGTLAVGQVILIP